MPKHRLILPLDLPQCLPVRPRRQIQALPKIAEHLLDEIGITVNKNQIPFDKQPPNTSSGIRVGTPAVTSRGMGPDEMRSIAGLIADAIEQRDDTAAQAALAGRVAAISGRFAVPGLQR